MKTLTKGFGIEIVTPCDPAWDKENGNYRMKDILEFAANAEKFGLDHLWHADMVLPHFNSYNTSWYDPLIVLTAASAVTSKVKLCQSIVVPHLRNLITFAKQGSSIDNLTNGRFMLGAGAGHYAPEFEACGVDFIKRAKIFHEFIDALKRLWSEEEVNFEGKYFKLRNVSLWPRPVQKPRPPIILAGGGRPDVWGNPEKLKKIISRIVDTSEGWVGASRIPNDAIVTVRKVIESRLKEKGKNADDFMVFAHRFIHIVKDESKAKKLVASIVGGKLEDLKAEHLVGTKQDIKANMKKMIERTEINGFFAKPFGIDNEALEFFAKEVVPDYIK
jgi:alkanesulfonate monooxygenase SsuD/methylene tetrahydromethanopterin reductase-like flavin-dependent oxidoreductase (luciferase family)